MTDISPVRLIQRRVRRRIMHTGRQPKRIQIQIRVVRIDRLPHRERTIRGARLLRLLPSPCSHHLLPLLLL